MGETSASAETYSRELRTRNADYSTHCTIPCVNDNSSVDGTREWLETETARSPPLQFVKADHVSPVAARGQAIPGALQDILGLGRLPSRCW
jgi:hypothetical protein